MKVPLPTSAFYEFLIKQNKKLDFRIQHTKNPVQLVSFIICKRSIFDMFHQFLLLYEKPCVQFLSSRATERAKILHASVPPSGEYHLQILSNSAK